MEPKVTVVIPFYNCPYIGRAIASALNQTYPHVEIIVVDDGSTKHVGLIEPFIDSIVYLRKLNGGTASAMNMGITRASGDYIAWLSSDDMFLPHKLRRQMDFMLHEQSLFSFTAFSTMNPQDQISEEFMGVNVREPGGINAVLAKFNPINGCTVIARRELFTLFGLFDESLPYTQDYDMWLRLAIGGIPLDYLPEALTLYRVHHAMGSIRYRPQLIAEFQQVQSKYAQQIKWLLADI